MRMWTTGMLDVVDIERLIMSQHISLAGLIPGLYPDEVTVLFLGEPLFPRIVYSLDDCTRSSRGFQEVWYSTTMTKRVHGPTRLWDHIQVRLQPLVTWNKKDKNRVN